MKKLVLLFTCLLAQPASALIIEFDYSFDGGFFSGANAGRRTTLEQAASAIGDRLQDQLNAATYSSLSFVNPQAAGVANLSNVSITANTIRIYAGGESLSGSTLATGGPGGGSGSTSALNRGQTGVGTTDFAPWGGSITFDNNGTNWFFDTDTSTDEGFSGFDFFSVALHEIGHVLGYGTADSWDALVSGSLFTGSDSTAMLGGSVPLASALDDAHWQDGLMFNGESLAMDPTIAGGTRKRFTELDFAGLSDIGWEVAAVAAVPVPPAVWLFGSAIGMLISFRRKQTS